MKAGQTRHKMDVDIDPAFAHKLSLYHIPPTSEVTTEQFERYASDRLEVLREIDFMQAKGIKGTERQNRLRDVANRLLPIHQSSAYDQTENICKDVVSHFTLRLAFCQTRESREWFLKQERELMRFRLMNIPANELSNVLKENNVNYNNISPALFKELHAKLQRVMNARWNNNNITITAADFYEVEFESALNLVRNRKVLMHAGNALVHRDQLTEIVLSHFRSHLSQSLIAASHAFHAVVSGDERVAPLMSQLSTRLVNRDFKWKQEGGQADLSDIDAVAKRSFPLCMRHLHEMLRANHHLKHGGRMQLGLFLKGIGLSLDAALDYWRSEFVQKMPGEKFDKQYAYTIKHNYGTVGKRTDYSPYGCAKIISAVASGTEDHHGCPFRHFDERSLRAKLASYGTATTDIDDIIHLVSGHHYQVACRRYFEVTHPSNQSVSVATHHPNTYFTESVTYFGAVEGKGAAGVKTEHRSAAPQKMDVSAN